MRLAIIGGGNMGAAIGAGAINYNIIERGELVISHLSEKCHNLFDDLSDIVIVKDNKEAIKGADIIIVAVKPWLMGEVLGEISPLIDRKRQILISIAAGVTFNDLDEILECDKYGKLPIYRIIPNTAIIMGEGTIFITMQNTTEAQNEAVLELFAPLGVTFIIEEEKMNAYQALSSCGIAYVYKYIDGSIKGGVEIGLDEELSRQVVLQTVRGALLMLDKSGNQPQVEIDKVTTKGGYTFRGLAAMQEFGFTQAIVEGLKASL